MNLFVIGRLWDWKGETDHTAHGSVGCQHPKPVNVMMD